MAAGRSAEVLVFPTILCILAQIRFPRCINSMLCSSVYRHWNGFVETASAIGPRGCAMFVVGQQRWWLGVDFGLSR